MSTSIKEKVISVKELMELPLIEDELDKNLFMLKKVDKTFGDLYLKMDGKLGYLKNNCIDVAAFTAENAFKYSIEYNLEMVKKPDNWIFIPKENL